MLDLNNRKVRRELWRRVEKAGRRAGESLDQMLDLAECGCGGFVRTAPPAMALEFLKAVEATPVAIPSCEDKVVWISDDGRRPVICDRCHYFMFDDASEFLPKGEA